MNKYPASQPASSLEVKEAGSLDDLSFPIDRDFLSRPPRLDPQVMLRRIAETMPWRSTRPGEQERRRALKIDAEFVL